MQIVYADNDREFGSIRHVTRNGAETLCGMSTGPVETLALPVNCPECRTINGRIIRQSMQEGE